MDFFDVLQEEFEKLKHCDALVLMGMDGLAVAQVTAEKPPEELEYFTAEYTSGIQLLNDVLKKLSENSIREHIHIFGDAYVFCEFINDQYYLLAFTKHDVLLGYARYRLKRLAERIAPEMQGLA